MNKIDWNKPLETYMNKPATRVLRLDSCPDDFRNVVRYQNSCGGGEYTLLVDDYGRPQKCGSEFIHNKPEPKKTVTGFVNVYPDNLSSYDFGFHTTKKEADEESSPFRVACVPFSITYSEGEGL